MTISTPPESAPLDLAHPVEHPDPPEPVPAPSPDTATGPLPPPRPVPPAWAAPTGPAGPPPSATRDRRPGWVGVGAAAAIAALLASLGTAAATGAFDADGAAGAARTVSTAPVVAADGTVDWQAVATAVRPSVVAIGVSGAGGGGEGSGVIIDSAGHVLTNDHVVDGAREITVTLSDGRLVDAEVVGTDPTTDVAVIRLVDPPADLAVATLGDSDEIAVGAPVMAVGNPLGLDSTVTTGIVSAVNRPVTTGNGNSAVVTNAIQVDAAVNPGNSGGPLFDAGGRVVGITSSIATLSSQSGSIGLGFAIPVNQVLLVADQLIETGTAEHAYLGVTLTDGEATSGGVTRRGAVVRSVGSGTPAEVGGLAPGDVVVAVDGLAVSGAESLTGFVRQHAGGDEVSLTVVRDGAELGVRVTLDTRPAD